MKGDVMVTPAWWPLHRGEIGLCHLPGRDRALALDVAAIAQSRPSLVISLTEPAETPPGLPDLLRGHGIEWLNFPIPDYGTPLPDAPWPALSRHLHDLAQQGGRVLVHCHGGKGRSGMIVLRLMVEAGADPALALAAVRRLRPGAVETEAQEAWAMGRNSG